MYYNIVLLGHLISHCYNSKTLELVKEKNLVLKLTQENSIENSVQDCLPYISRLMVCATTIISLL